jgi:hypothetical protein
MGGASKVSQLKGIGKKGGEDIIVKVVEEGAEGLARMGRMA